MMEAMPKGTGSRLGSYLPLIPDRDLVKTRQMDTYFFDTGELDYAEHKSSAARWFTGLWDLWYSSWPVLLQPR